MHLMGMLALSAYDPVHIFPIDQCGKGADERFVVAYRAAQVVAPVSFGLRFIWIYLFENPELDVRHVDAHRAHIFSSGHWTA